MNPRFLLLLAVSLVAPVLSAADWPQWRGPDRTDISRETGLLRSWPAGGPKLLWSNDDAGVGYAGIAVVGDRLFTMGARGETEYVYALDVATGKQAWAAEVGPLFNNQWGSGPRGTPTVDGDVLYAIGGQGNLVCIETAGGKERWRVGLKRDLSGEMMSGWGYTESPLLDGGKVICTPGGKGGTLAALDKQTGKVLWRSKGLTDPAAYSSVIVAEVGGVRQYVQMTGQSIAGVAAADGRRLWRVPQSFKTAVIPTPIFHDNCVYQSAGYGFGCVLIRLTPAGKEIKAEQVYANKNMTNHHGGVVLVGEHLYGYSEGKGWVCQDFKTGDIVWAERSKHGKGSVTCADGKLFCYGEDKGSLAVIDATPDGWKEHGRFTIPKETSVRSPRGKIWTHPVVANGRLYLRDQDLIYCYDIKAE